MRLGFLGGGKDVCVDLRPGWDFGDRRQGRSEYS